MQRSDPGSQPGQRGEETVVGVIEAAGGGGAEGAQLHEGGGEVVFGFGALAAEGGDSGPFLLLPGLRLRREAFGALLLFLFGLGVGIYSVAIIVVPFACPWA